MVEMRHILLRKMFFVNNIYESKTFLSNAFDLFLVFLLVAIILPSLPGLPDPGLRVFLGALAAYMLMRLLVLSSIKNAIFKSRKYPGGSWMAATRFFRSSTHDELDNADKVQLIASGKDWNLFDAIFNFYRRTKYGGYLSKQAFYTVYEHKLSRVLPNLIFDSKRAKGRQYRYRYLATQKISLEGNFDSYFDTYAPHYYVIDSLGFISPEVMHTLIDASSYDIELVDDSLFIYGPLLDESGLKNIQAHGKKIAQAINDNIDTYRDSYIADKERSRQVTPFARTLLKSPLKSIVAASVFGLVTASIITAAITYKSGEAALNEFSISIYIFFVTYLYRAIKIVRDNKKQHESFLLLRRYYEQKTKDKVQRRKPRSRLLIGSYQPRSNT